MYSSLGSFRSARQAVSYEVSMIFIVLICLLVWFDFGFCYLNLFSFGFMLLFFCLPLCFLWIISCLAESNRSPFDLSEGESELVSGFNTEYSGGLFSLFFIAEYSFMLFLSYATVLLFFGGGIFYIKVIFLCFFYVWVRGSLPGMRFDHLIIFS